MKRVRLVILFLFFSVPLFQLGIELLGGDHSEQLDGLSIKSTFSQLSDDYTSKLKLNDSLNSTDSFNGPEVWAPPEVTLQDTPTPIPTSSMTTITSTPNEQKQPPASKPAPSSTISGTRKTLKMTVDNVTLVQKSLNKAGFYSGEFNGIFDDKLLTVIKEFQRYVDLEPDGIVDSAMIKYLDIYSSGCESAYALKINLSNS